MNNIQKIVYVAGRYRGETEDDVFENIMLARRVAKEIWSMGFTVFCPHLNSAFMGGTIPDPEWLRRDLVILERCDIICMVPGWEQSEGARGELEYAKKIGKKVWIVEQFTGNSFSFNIL